MRKTSGDATQAPKIRLSWRLGQAIRRNRQWRKVADAWWRFNERDRITVRYPNATAAIAWFVAFIATMVLIYVAYTLYANAPTS